MIRFNKPYLSGKEIEYIGDSVQSGKVSGDGIYTQKCHQYFEEKYGFRKCLLTTSCTSALEMAAILAGIQPGDEVIMPSYTFVSTANAFVLRGAKIIFCDSQADHPNIDETKIESLITTKTKAIVVVHYAGVACEMDSICALAKKFDLFLIEDAAQAIDSCYKGKPLGSFGHFSAFSFHETKNVISGEGGMLVINDDKYIERGEIIREKGTNRSKFFRGEIDKYSWVDIGSSFLPSDIIAAFLFAQLENMVSIQEKRKKVWHRYYDNLSSIRLDKAGIQLPFVFDYATNNAHMFYLICETLDQRNRLIEFLRTKNIHAVFHYLSLHNSAFFLKKNSSVDLPNTDRFTDRLVRLPFYFELTLQEVDYITNTIQEFVNIE